MTTRDHDARDLREKGIAEKLGPELVGPKGPGRLQRGDYVIIEDDTGPHGEPANSPFWVVELIGNEEDITQTCDSVDEALDEIRSHACQKGVRHIRVWYTDEAGMRRVDPFYTEPKSDDRS